MFGFVTAHIEELTPEEKRRYRSVYCGICRSMGKCHSKTCRLCLSYDTAFLALLLSSLYEPQESCGKSRCAPHLIKPQSWQESQIISYAACMNVALGYFSAKDHWADDRKLAALFLSKSIEKHYPAIAAKYTRQCTATEDALKELSRLEQENCSNPDLPANAFGYLLGEWFVWQEDLWSPCLRNLGRSLGRFIYLADAAIDYHKDLRTGSYNPFIAMGEASDPARLKEYLTAEMAACTDAYERLPLVQDKPLLDNILYSGIWLSYRQKERRGKRNG